MEAKHKLDMSPRCFSWRRKGQALSFLLIVASFLVAYKICMQNSIERFKLEEGQQCTSRSSSFTRTTTCYPIAVPCKTDANLHVSPIGGKFMEDMKEERPLAQFATEPTFEASQGYLKRCGLAAADLPLTMVHLVKSAVGNKDRRKAIRDTWGAIKSHRGFRNEIVFVVGLPKTADVSDDVERENNEFGDILQLNQVDNAGLVPEKVVAGMQWASSKLRENVLYTSVDDDILVHIPNLVKYIRDTYTLPHMPESSIPCYEDLPIICTYSYQDKDIPSRNPKSKWFMPREWYPNDTWPRYCRGGMYVAPVKIVRGLFEASRRTARLYLDDVWVTGFMRRKLGKGDTNIAPAPHSQRSDYHLQHDDVDPADVIVRHTWGNIAEKPVDVTKMLRQRYRDWNVNLNGSCVSPLSYL